MNFLLNWKSQCLLRNNSVLILQSLTIWGSLVEKSKDCLRPRGQCQGRQLLWVAEKPPEGQVGIFITVGPWEKMGQESLWSEQSKGRSSWGRAELELHKRLSWNFCGQGPLWSLGVCLLPPGGNHSSQKYGALVKYFSLFWKHNHLPHSLLFLLQPLHSPPRTPIFAGIYRRLVSGEDSWALLSEICFRKAWSFPALPTPPFSNCVSIT